MVEWEEDSDDIGAFDTFFAFKILCSTCSGFAGLVNLFLVYLYWLSLVISVTLFIF